MATAQHQIKWQRMATELATMGFDDHQLDEIHAWYEHIDDTEMAWLQFGEALFEASNGQPLGFKLWAAWSKATSPEWFDMGHHLIIWRRFVDHDLPRN